MATTTMATATAAAAGLAMLLYFVLSRLISINESDVDAGGGGDLSKERCMGRRRIVRRPAQAPETWREAVATLAETLRFTYSETLGKWPIGDLAFGIKYLMRRQGNLQIASEFAGNNCVQLNGPEIMSELIDLLRLLTFCMLFSKKPFPVFLESAGFSEEDVLIQEPKAGLLRPAFTIIHDKSSKSFLLLIRGTHSIKDTLTAATGAVVPFHHLALHEGGISNLALGYAHCGMVAAARRIAKCTTPCLLKAVNEHPDYSIKKNDCKRSRIACVSSGNNSSGTKRSPKFPWKEVYILPVQWHALAFGLFASIIAPFGGFYASGFKRAFRIKDFGDSIPGHGGITDRMDCQMVMAVFAYIYHQSFIIPETLSIEMILEQILRNLTFEEQQSLYMQLGEIFQERLPAEYFACHSSAASIYLLYIVP